MYPYITILNKNISVYGILMFLGVLIVFLLSFKKARKFDVSLDNMLIIGAFSLLFALTFSNLLYIFVSYPISEVIFYIRSGKFQFLGGLVYYGGLIGGIIGAVLGIKVAKAKIAIIENCVVPYIPIGHAIGRIGCLMAGCCNGIKYNGILAVHYANSVNGISANQGYFPVQFIEAVLNILIAIFLIIYSKKKRPTYNTLFLYLSSYSVMRFLLEFLRGDQIRGIYFGFSLSQWISLILFFISAIYFLIKFSKIKQAV